MASLPAPTKRPSLSQMNKLVELKERSMTVHPKWTVPELRSILSEERAKEKKIEDNVPKGLSSMTLAELKKAGENSTDPGLHPRQERADRELRTIRRVPVPGGASGVPEVGPGRGPAQRQCLGGSTIVCDVGRTDANKKKVIQAKSYYVDPEATAMVPYNPETGSSSSPPRTSVTGLAMRGGYADPGPPRRRELMLPPAPRPEQAVPCPKPCRPTRRQQPDHESMDLDAKEIDTEALEEIKALEMRLALLRDRHHLPPRHE